MNQNIQNNDVNSENIENSSINSTNSINSINQTTPKIPLSLEMLGLTVDSPLEIAAEKLAILKITQIPHYQDIQASQLKPAIDWALHKAQIALKTIENLKPEDATWDNIINYFEEETACISYIWGLSNHFSGVCDSKEWREAVQENIERMTHFYLSVSQNPAFYAHYKHLKTLETLSLDAAQHKMLDDALLEFKLSGAELSSTEQAKFIELQTHSANLKKKISDNVLDSVDHFVDYLSADELIGVPASYLENWWDEAHAAYQITLKQPCITPIMQYCENRDLRERLYKTQITLASEITVFHQGLETWNNETLIHDLLVTRHATANLLGFENYAELSIANKMANSAQEVIDFISNIATQAKSVGEKDLLELQTHAKTMGLETFEPWDMSYVSENLKQKAYSYSEQEVKQYFTLDKVLKGLFDICDKLFGIQIQQVVNDGINTTDNHFWNEDVNLYCISKNQEVQAYFYLDLFARDQKHGGAWMNYALSYRKKSDGSTQKPVAYLICNFQKPKEGQAILSYYELTTLFHEFGHGIHHMLTKIHYPAISGIEGVEWDAVELPSQFMENFCWDYPLLQSMSEHIKTKESLPKALFDKMLAARNYQNGLATLRQSVYAMFDVRVHIEYPAASNLEKLQKLQTMQTAEIDINNEDHKQGLLAEFAGSIQKQLHVLPQNVWSRWPNTFTHIFAGGYAVGYYSYHWAEVLSADVFAAFEEAQAQQPNAQILNAELGKRYLEEILSRGGSRKALDNFTAFRGRAPKIDAFLRHNGLLKN